MLTDKEMNALNSNMAIYNQFYDIIHGYIADADEKHEINDQRSSAVDEINTVTKMIQQFGTDDCTDNYHLCQSNDLAQKNHQVGNAKLQGNQTGDDNKQLKHDSSNINNSNSKKNKQGSTKGGKNPGKK